MGSLVESAAIMKYKYDDYICPDENFRNVVNVAKL